MLVGMRAGWAHMGSTPYCSCPLGDLRDTLASSLGYLRDTHLLTVLAHVRVHLTEGTQHAEVTCVQAGLLSQVCIHILVTDGWQFGDICIVPAREKTGSGARDSWAKVSRDRTGVWGTGPLSAVCLLPQIPPLLAAWWPANQTLRGTFYRAECREPDLVVGS